MHHFFWVVGENEAGFSQTNPATWYRQQPTCLFDACPLKYHMGE
jgi:hypothetical protein